MGVYALVDRMDVRMFVGARDDVRAEDDNY